MQSAEEYLKGLHVLYVEDDEDEREQFVIFLKRFTSNLTIAKDGQEGLEAYHAQHPQIIVTDIQMPRMNGLEMVEAIRTVDTSVCIIVLTAFEQVDYLKTSINMGVNKYVTKPIDGMQLKKTLLECANSLYADESLKNAASVDPLTGLLNRRELSGRFLAEKNTAERYETPFSLIMIDIDHFKNINDTYGHIAGDHVLKGVANIIRTSLRREDISGRWGGEEFLLILPRIRAEEAAIVAEKLRLAVMGMKIQWEGHGIMVTISLGVGQFRPGEDMDGNIQHIDKALYQAKTEGRNRYVVAGQAYGQ